MAEIDGLHVPPARPPSIRALGPVLKLARRLPKPITYALAGGGSHGAVQWGSLQSLAETDVRPDFLIGTSAGAFTGSVFAEDPTSAVQRLSYVWGQLSVKNMLGDGLLSAQLISNARQSALIDDKALRETLETIYQARTFADLQVPFGAVATDLSTGLATVLDSGDLIEALLASSAIPGVMPPVLIEDRLYCDGLASANLPVSLAVERGAGSVIVLESGSRELGDVSTTPAKMMSRVAAILSSRQRDRQLRDAASAVPVIVLPTPTDLGSTMDFTQSMSAGATSYELGREFLTELAMADHCVLAPGIYAPTEDSRPS